MYILLNCRGVVTLNYKEFWKQISEKNEELNALYHSYWHQFSDMGSWQFWMIISLLLLPLILLFFTVDRKRIFELFFFGFIVHVLWSYIIIALGRSGYFMHHYFILPVLPIAINVTASVLPIGFLLLYQYCTNRQKNFYIYTLLLSVIFAFGFASIERYLGMTSYKNGMRQFYLFLIDIGVVYIAYWSTKLLLKVKEKANS